MTIKANENGAITLTYDGSSSIGYVNEINSAYASSSISNVIEEITKKPEVRVDQKSSLEITSKIVAKFYKDGFFTDSKYLIPAIKSIEVFNANTVKMTFVNGNVQKVTAQAGDKFSFEDGVLRCIVQEMIGKEGGAVLNKLLSYATKVYNDAEDRKKKKAAEEEKKRIAAEKNYKKLQKHWEKKRAAARENRIQEMAEAIIRAEEMKKNV